LQEETGVHLWLLQPGEQQLIQRFAPKKVMLLEGGLELRYLFFSFW